MPRCRIFLEVTSTLQHKAVLVAGCMCFVCKLPFVFSFYEHSAVRVCSGNSLFCGFVSPPTPGDGVVFIISSSMGFCPAFSLSLTSSMKADQRDLCCLRNLFLLELFLVGAGFDMGAVNENCAGVQHPVIQCLVEDVLKNLTGQLIWKAFAECIAHRRKVGDIIQQSIPKKPPICYIHLNFPVGLPQRRYSEQMLNEYHLTSTTGSVPRRPLSWQ